jgi:hypothetical protein
VPQDEDTGGFFVATLRKVARPVSEKRPAEAAAPSEAPVQDGEDCDEAACAAAAADEEEPRASKQVYRGPVDFHQWDEETFSRIKQFYGFHDSLTREAFFIREDFSLSGNSTGAGGAAKSIYLIPASVRALMKGDRDGRLKVVTAGVKVFEKKVLRSGDVDYRLLQV